MIQLPWITPPIIGAFLATGFSWTAAVLAVVNLAISVLIWSVFVIMANRIGLNPEDSDAETAKAVSAA
jgi:PTS system cellobiose-specific IIC component